MEREKTKKLEKEKVSSARRGLIKPKRSSTRAEKKEKLNEGLNSASSSSQPQEGPHSLSNNSNNNTINNNNEDKEADASQEKGVGKTLMSDLRHPPGQLPDNGCQ
jgi:hypothetical protein